MAQDGIQKSAFVTIIITVFIDHLLSYSFNENFLCPEWKALN